MRAITVRQPGGPEVLEMAQLPDPVPGPGELLVAVRATAVNRADVLQRQGRYPPPPGASDVLGLEIAGRVARVAPDVAGWTPGDAVCAVVTGGGYAELALVPAREALPVPDGLDLLEAAAVPEVFTTAYDNLVNRGRLGQGETVLIHGGASGVGTAGIQLARREGVRVLVTAGSARKVDACVALGAAHGIDYHREDFVDVALEHTDGRGVDVVLDMVGGSYLERNLAVLAPEGRLVVIGLQGGASATLPLGKLMTRRLTVTGSTLRARPAAAKAALAEQMRARVWPGFERGELRPVIDRVLPLSEAGEAHRVMEAGEHIGKIVLEVAPDYS